MKLWIRADGSQSMGLGHISRTSAIAEEAATSGLDVTYITASDPLTLQMLARRNLDFIDVQTFGHREWVSLVHAGDLVLFDGYQFSDSEYSVARATGGMVVALDDYGAGRFDVDFLINPNPLDSHDYEIGPGTALLIGPSYAPIRAEFRKKRRLRWESRRTVLLTMGGTDVARGGDAVLEALVLQTDFPEIMVLRGPGAAASSAGLPAERVTTIIDPPSVADVFDAADVAVSAAGSTVWELLCMGLPTVLIQVADNQRHVVSVGVKSDSAIFAGGLDHAVKRMPEILKRLAGANRRKTLSANALGCVDGLGARRIIKALTS